VTVVGKNAPSYRLSEGGHWISCRKRQ